MLDFMLYEPKVDPSMAKFQVVPLARYIENV